MTSQAQTDRERALALLQDFATWRQQAEETAAYLPDDTNHVDACANIAVHFDKLRGEMIDALTPTGFTMSTRRLADVEMLGLEWCRTLCFCMLIVAARQINQRHATGNAA